MKGGKDKNCESEGRGEVRERYEEVWNKWKIRKCEREGPSLLSKVIFNVQIRVEYCVH